MVLSIAFLLTLTSKHLPAQGGCHLLPGLPCRLCSLDVIPLTLLLKTSQWVPPQYNPNPTSSSLAYSTVCGWPRPPSVFLTLVFLKQTSLILPQALWGSRVFCPECFLRSDPHIAGFFLLMASLSRSPYQEKHSDHRI